MKRIVIIEKRIVIIEKDCDNCKFSRSINEVIQAVLNFLFFYEKISHAQKSQKALKVPKASKALKGTKTLGREHKNAIKRISDYFSLRCFLEAFFIFVRL